MGCRPVPEFENVFRWKNAMPQYHVGHHDRVSRIESLAAATVSYTHLTLPTTPYV